MFSTSGANFGEPTRHQACNSSVRPLLNWTAQTTGPSEMSSCQELAPANEVIEVSPPDFPITAEHDQAAGVVGQHVAQAVDQFPVDGVTSANWRICSPRTTAC